MATLSLSSRCHFAWSGHSNSHDMSLLGRHCCRNHFSAIYNLRKRRQAAQACAAIYLHAIASVHVHPGHCNLLRCAEHALLLVVWVRTPWSVVLLRAHDFCACTQLLITLGPRTITFSSIAMAFSLKAPPTPGSLHTIAALGALRARRVGRTQNPCLPHTTDHPSLCRYLNCVPYAPQISCDF